MLDAVSHGASFGSVAAFQGSGQREFRIDVTGSGNYKYYSDLPDEAVLAAVVGAAGNYGSPFSFYAGYSKGVVTPGSYFMSNTNEKHTMAALFKIMLLLDHGLYRWDRG